MKNLLAGAGVADITPLDPQYLFGYPHVERTSTGVHDPLLSSALYLFDGRTPLLFVANDIIFVGKATAGRVRQRIEAETGVPAANILVSATHTHSGPSTVDYISLADDSFVPRVDTRYLQRFEDGIVAAAVEAVQRAQPAEAGLAIADGAGVGTNRRDTTGPADPQVPVLLARSAANGTPIACMLVCSMHPTVLRETSTVVSGDFPGMARRLLAGASAGGGLPSAAPYRSGGQPEPAPCAARQHGGGSSAVGRDAWPLCRRCDRQRSPLIHLSIWTRSGRWLISHAGPSRPWPTPSASSSARRRSWRICGRWVRPRQEVRGAEVDWFGAEETVRLARLAAEGGLADAYQSCLPAEVQAFKLGPWTFVGWPGEIFVEYALAVKAAARDTYVISLANGELQGYITTEAAAAEGGYEASNAIFAPATGQTLVDATLRLVAPQ